MNQRSKHDFYRMTSADLSSDSDSTIKATSPSFCSQDYRSLLQQPIGIEPWKNNAPSIDRDDNTHYHGDHDRKSTSLCDNAGGSHEKSFELRISNANSNGCEGPFKIDYDAGTKFGPCKYKTHGSRNSFNVDYSDVLNKEKRNGKVCCKSNRDEIYRRPRREVQQSISLASSTPIIRQLRTSDYQSPCRQDNYEADEADNHDADASGPKDYFSKNVEKFVDETKGPVEIRETCLRGSKANECEYDSTANRSGVGSKLRGEEAVVELYADSFDIDDDANITLNCTDDDDTDCSDSVSGHNDHRTFFSAKYEADEDPRSEDSRGDSGSEISRRRSLEENCRSGASSDRQDGGFKDIVTSTVDDDLIDRWDNYQHELYPSDSEMAEERLDPSVILKDWDPVNSDDFNLQNTSDTDEDEMFQLFEQSGQALRLAHKSLAKLHSINQSRGLKEIEATCQTNLHCLEAIKAATRQQAFINFNSYDEILLRLDDLMDKWSYLQEEIISIKSRKTSSGGADRNSTQIESDACSMPQKKAFPKREHRTPIESEYNSESLTSEESNIDATLLIDIDSRKGATYIDTTMPDEKVGSAIGEVKVETEIYIFEVNSKIIQRANSVLNASNDTVNKLVDSDFVGSFETLACSLVHANVEAMGEANIKVLLSRTDEKALTNDYAHLENFADNCNSSDCDSKEKNGNIEEDQNGYSTMNIICADYFIEKNGRNSRSNDVNYNGRQINDEASRLDDIPQVKNFEISNNEFKLVKKIEEKNETLSYLNKFSQKGSKKRNKHAMKNTNKIAKNCNQDKIETCEHKNVRSNANYSSQIKKTDEIENSSNIFVNNNPNECLLETAGLKIKKECRSDKFIQTSNITKNSNKLNCLVSTIKHKSELEFIDGFKCTAKLKDNIKETCESKTTNKEPNYASLNVCDNVKYKSEDNFSSIKEKDNKCYENNYGVDLEDSIASKSKTNLQEFQIVKHRKKKKNINHYKSKLEENFKSNPFEDLLENKQIKLILLSEEPDLITSSQPSADIKNSKNLEKKNKYLHKNKNLSTLTGEAAKGTIFCTIEKFIIFWLFNITLFLLFLRFLFPCFVNNFKIELTKSPLKGQPPI